VSTGGSIGGGGEGGRGAVVAEVVMCWWCEIQQFLHRVPDNFDAYDFTRFQLTHPHKSVDRNTYEYCGCLMREDERSTTTFRTFLTKYLSRPATFQLVYTKTLSLLLLGRSDVGSSLSQLPIEILHLIII